MDEWIDRSQHALRWAVRRWHQADAPPLWVILIALALICAACAYRPVWIRLRHGVTIIHEMGHVTVAWLFGRRVAGISLHNDTSGLTLTSGKQHGIGMLMTLLAGYTAPPLLGLGLVWAAVEGWAGAALTVLSLILLMAFWLLRNAFGLITVSGFLGLSAFVWLKGSSEIVTTFVVVVGLFLLVAALRGGFDLWKIHDRSEGQGSDAAQASDQSIFPASFWVWFFAVVSALCAVQAVQLTVRGLHLV